MSAVGQSCVHVLDSLSIYPVMHSFIHLFIHSFTQSSLCWQTLTIVIANLTRNDIASKVAPRLPAAMSVFSIVVNNSSN